MKQFFTLRLPLFILGFIGLFSLLCSIAAACVTNPALMQQGFLAYAQTRHLNVSPTRYDECARGICDYLNGKTNVIVWEDSGDNMFSEKEMLHLSDVRIIVRALKLVRWIGGSGAVLGVAAAYLAARFKKRPGLMNLALRGFSYASIAWLSIGVILGVWGIINFDGLFVTFHLAAFSNDLWILDPNTDLMVALMPLNFFIWYAGELLKSMLPVIGIMLCLPIACFRIRRKEHTDGGNRT